MDDWSDLRGPRRRRGGLFSSLANVLAVALLVMALAAAGLAGFFVLNPAALPPSLSDLLPATPTRAAVALPTAVAAAALPEESDAPELPAAAGIAATFTPDTRPTERPAATNTRSPTLTPSMTPFLPSRTPLPTPTDTPTVTPTPGPSPSATNTLSPFPFTRTADSPFYLRKFTSSNCSYVAGEVLDVNGNQAAPNSYRIHIWDADGRSNGIDTRLAVGNAPAYGQSGWEILTSPIPEVRVFNLQLESNSGTPVSTPYQVQTAGDCQRNVTYLIFIQNR